MALKNAPAGGSYFEFDVACNENALIAFKIRAFQPPRLLTNEADAKPVDPVLVDFVVLTGSQARTVVRGESVIGNGITGPLSRSAIGDDIVARMQWGKTRRGVNYPQANPGTDADMAMAADVFQKTNGDPYSAAERAANPTATLAPVQAAPAPVQPPAPAASASWDGGTDSNAPAAQVGGPQGPSWDAAPASNGHQAADPAAAW